MKKLILLVAILSTVSFVSCGKNEVQIIEEAPAPASSETESEEKSETNIETETEDKEEVTVEEQSKTEEIPQTEEKKSEEEIAELAQEVEPKAEEKQEVKDVPKAEPKEEPKVAETNIQQAPKSNKLTEAEKKENVKDLIAPQSPNAVPMMQIKPNTLNTDDAIKMDGQGEFSRYNVIVYDIETPAAYTSGQYQKEGFFYNFYSEDDRLLGRLPELDLMVILREKPELNKMQGDGSLKWFTEQFNVYRGTQKGEYIPIYDHGADKSFDAEKNAQRVLELVNIEREKRGIAPIKLDKDAVDYANMRLEQLDVEFSHERDSYKGCFYGENIAKGEDTPEQVVNDWMNSKGHREALLYDSNIYENKVGIACGNGFKNGTLWVYNFLIHDNN